MFNNQKAAPIGTAFWLPRTVDGGVALGADVLSEPNDGDDRRAFAQRKNILSAGYSLASQNQTFVASLTR
jgi:hypothetical protein